MTRDPLVSIIIPTLDRATLTIRAYASAKKQTYSKIEIIVVDNGSIDIEQSMLRESGIAFESEPIKGAGAARRRGLALARGDYLLFLDSDDELLPNSVELLLNNIHDDSHLIYGQMINVNDTQSNFLHLETKTHTPLASCSLIRSDAFDKFGEMGMENFSWPRWCLSSKDNGLVDQQLAELVAYRHIHGENLSMTESSYGEFFKIIRERIAGGRAK